MGDLTGLFKGIVGLADWRPWVMFLIGGILIFLAIKKKYEPMLLLPIGFGAILANIPSSAVIDGEHGFLNLMYEVGIKTELFPLLIFIAIGAMIDFTPIFKNPFMMFFGAAAQLGIFLTMLMAICFGFDIAESAAIGIIGSADGPTSIFVSNTLLPNIEHRGLVAAIAVAAYSYMALVPIIQPPIIKLLTTKKERQIKMTYTDKPVPKWILIVFPIAVTLISGIFAPVSLSLVGTLMFGNLIRECGVLEKLSQTAQNELANLVTLFLGITVGSTMTAENFLNLETIKVLGMGLLAFAFGTASGVIFAKIVNLFRKEKINPMIGAAGVSAFPMSARVVQKVASEEDPNNFILMQAISANVSGQIGSAIAGGIIISLVAMFI
jgi:oxaloacetate decarboxylase beta subunit